MAACFTWITFIGGRPFFGVDLTRDKIIPLTYPAFGQVSYFSRLRNKFWLFNKIETNTFDSIKDAEVLIVFMVELNLTVV